MTTDYSYEVKAAALVRTLRDEGLESIKETTNDMNRISSMIERLLEEYKQGSIDSPMMFIELPDGKIYNLIHMRALGDKGVIAVYDMNLGGEDLENMKPKNIWIDLDFKTSPEPRIELKDTEVKYCTISNGGETIPYLLYKILKYAEGNESEEG